MGTFTVTFDAGAESGRWSYVLNARTRQAAIANARRHFLRDAGTHTNPVVVPEETITGLLPGKPVVNDLRKPSRDPKLGDRPRAVKGPRCGHSICSQNYIDTGETRCVQKEAIDMIVGNAALEAAVMARKPKPPPYLAPLGYRPDTERIAVLSANEARGLVLALCELLFPADDDLDMGETIEVIEDLLQSKGVIK